MKLSIFWPDILHYHAARINALCRLASQLNHSINVYSFRDKTLYWSVPSYYNLVDENVKIIHPRSKEDNVNSRFMKNQLLKQLKIDNPDVVVIVGYYFGVSRAALGWCRFNKKAAILLFDSQEMDKNRKWWKEYIKKVLVSLYDFALVGGKRHEEYLSKLGMSKDRIITKCNVVDNSFWSSFSQVSIENSEYLRYQYKIPKDIFLSVGRLVKKKNYKGLLRAYSLYIRKTKNPWDLVIVGDGELKKELECFSNEMGIANHTHFLGAKSAEELAPIYGISKVFILPSIEEQWGLVVNEAMCAGLPVIVSNRCGASVELIIEGETGFSFDPFNEEYLANLLFKFSNNEFNYKEMSEKSKQQIQNYSPEYFAKSIFTAAEAAINYSMNRKWNLYLPPEIWL